MDAGAALSAPLAVWARGDAPRMPRIMGAVAAAIALHAAVLILHPGVSGGPVSAPVASALSVRILYAAPAVAPALKPDASPATKPEALVIGDTTPADRKDERIEPRPSARSTSRAEPAASSDSGLAAALDYALGVKLDPGPRPLDEIEPDYPDVVNLRSGTVVLRLLISDTGRVDDVSVVRAEPVGVFEQAAIEAFAKARFAPGMAGGRPVKSQIRVEVEFMPINRGGRVSGRSY